ncbi:MAG: (2Fe-2S)-binding protein [Planctomycetes bacterium]|nr:(2Fe-2S)-binding protein [Planctomycetota bacterium]MCB9889304.1 (2Fe-2S)-binding protein [Planctomycetota bacterium]
MIVCSCHGLTDRDVRHAFGEGVADPCLAGSGCGNCLPLVDAIAHEVRQQRRAGDEATRSPQSQTAPSDDSRR